MKKMEHHGIISLIPVAVVIISAILTKRTTESLLFGSIAGFIALYGVKFFMPWLDAVYGVMMDSTTAWVILLFSLFGSLIALLEKSGGALGFSRFAVKITKTRKISLIVTWILGIIVFIDDYLNALAVGSVMRQVTDHYRVSREMLAYVINSTGAAVCVLIPFSTWSAFMAGQLEANNVLVNGSATAAYISCIPYSFYAWVSVLIVPLIILKIVPIYGGLKKAEKRALETGQVFPEGSKVQEEMGEVSAAHQEDVKLYNFAVPMLVLAIVTIWSSDMLIGVIAAIVSCAILYFPQKLMSFNTFCDHCIDGIKDMVPVMALLLAAFFLQATNDTLGLTPYVIEKAQAILSPALLPAVSFVIVGALAFATGSFWGLAAIAFPIIIPLAQHMDVNVFLASGAIISGATFGSHTCFYGDAVTLSCASTQIKNIDYVRTSIPIIAMPTVAAIILFVVFGFIM